MKVRTKHTLRLRVFIGAQVPMTAEEGSDFSDERTAIMLRPWELAVLFSAPGVRRAGSGKDDGRVETSCRSDRHFKTGRESSTESCP